jgi:HEAT repeat protein
MSRKPKRKWILGSTLLALLVGTGAALRTLGTTRPTAAAQSAAQEARAEQSAPFRFAWARGVRYEYDLDIDAEAAVVLPQAGVGPEKANAMRIAGRFLVRSFGPRGDGTFLLGVGLGDLRRHELRILGVDALGDDAAARATFEGREGWVRIDARGVVHELYFKKDAPALFRGVITALVTMMQVTVSGDAAPAWDATEPGPNGIALARYAASGTGGLSLERSRLVYEKLTTLPGGAAGRQALAARGKILLDAAGIVGSIDDEEQLVVAQSDPSSPGLRSRTRLQARKVAEGTFDAPTTTTLDLALLDVVIPGDPARVPDAHAEAVRQRAEGMTLGVIETSVATFAGGDTLEKGWLQRATAFLTVHPEKCAALVPLFADHRTRLPSRMLIVDLLSAVDDPRAQAALRSALASPAARQDPRAFAAMEQRLGFVAHPDSETVAFLRSQFQSPERGSKDVRYGAAYALGASASALAKAGDLPGARRVAGDIKAALAQAATPAAKDALVTALGNARLEENVAEVTSYSKDADADVRSAAARALAQMPTHDSRETLVGMIGDADADVGATALRALGNGPASSDELDRLAALVTDGHVAGSNGPFLVEFLARHTDGGAPVRTMLEWLLANGASPRDAARIRQLLAFMQARG